MVRLKDIAAQAGVSVMTVSKALRDAPDISTATKARIRALAERLGYMPNSIAVGLRNKTTKLFGLVISAMTNPTYARVVMGIEEQAYELGYDVLIGQSLNQPEREQLVIKRMIFRRVDGLFITPVYRLEPTAPVYDELLHRRTPTVLLGHRAPFCERFVNVETEDIAASEVATQHLIELGHRRIAFFAGPASVPASRERLEGYRRALRDAGIESDDRLIFNAGSTIDEGEKAALQMLNESPGATAVQAVNDLVAIGAGTVFLSQGLRIPQDLSLVGFGNVLISEHFRVPLTTIRQPKFRLGAAAMDSMLKLLTGVRPATKRLPAEIVVRQSTAPPNPAAPSAAVRPASAESAD
jgi:DNA-binding LacI/PurR family transcriptional regulator